MAPPSLAALLPLSTDQALDVTGGMELNARPRASRPPGALDAQEGGVVVARGFWEQLVEERVAEGLDCSAAVVLHRLQQTGEAVIKRCAPPLDEAVRIEDEPSPGRYGRLSLLARLFSIALRSYRPQRI